VNDDKVRNCSILRYLDGLVGYSLLDLRACFNQIQDLGVMLCKGQSKISGSMHFG
jgi:hypothetical protein